MTTTDTLLIFDGSEHLHINTTYRALGQIAEMRKRKQETITSHDVRGIEAVLAKGWNPQRGQIDAFQLGQAFSKNQWLHRDNKDVLKLFITDREIYDSRVNMQYGLGVTLPFDNGSTYIVISVPHLGDEVHAQHVIAHELGHAYGAPNPRRKDVYASLGDHCENENCTMHQELNFADSRRSAHRIARLPQAFCDTCAYDIREYRR